MAERVTAQTQRYAPTAAEYTAWSSIAQVHKPDALGTHDQALKSSNIPQLVLEQAHMFDAIIANRHRRWASREICIQDIVEGRSIMQYDGEFDIENYQRVFTMQDAQERETALTQLDNYTRKQLVTHLGERVNVLLSTIDYAITSERQLYVPQLGKTAEQMVIDGRNHQLSLPDVREIDKPRMNAEILEMQQVETILCHPNTEVGTMVSVISAPGGQEIDGRDSLFLHNFYDVFRLEEREVDGHTEKYVRLYRYSSSLSYEEYLHVAMQLKRDYFASAEAEYTSLDAYFLSHVVKLAQSGLEEPEDVHKFFHRDHEFMTRQDFEEVIIPGTTELVERYITLMHKLALFSADDIRSEQAHTFNTLLIEADKLKDSLAVLQQNVLSQSNVTALRQQLVAQAQVVHVAYTASDIFRIGKQENVKQGGGACPGESGMRTGKSLDSISAVIEPTVSLNTSSFSLSADGVNSDEFGPLYFTCTKGHANTRPPHSKIPECTTCGEKFTEDCSS